ncbi:hypothetical protein ACFFX0_29115 [Citricoccus parietis]|uniref:Uncharacterized protein n=1 Tax=Citricoccus parietis TaxID=592307 RepID=A0ABV5G7V0_9MICC
MSIEVAGASASKYAVVSPSNIPARSPVVIRCRVIAITEEASATN